MTTSPEHFRVRFSGGYLDVYLYDVHPNTFAAWDAGRWGYCQEMSMHFVKSRLRIDTIVHEIYHIVESLPRKPDMADWMDELTRKFLKALYRNYPQYKKDRKFWLVD